MALLRLTSYAPTPTVLDLIAANGSDTGYRVLSPIILGNVAWEHAYAGARGSQGNRPAPGIPQNRTVQIPMRIGSPTGSGKDAVLQAMSRLATVVEEMRRFGGKLTRQGNGQTYREHYDVFVAQLVKEDWTLRDENLALITCGVGLTCAPYIMGDPFDVREEFSTDSTTLEALGDFTKRAGTAVAAAGGVLVPAATGLVRYHRTLEGYQFEDVEVTMKFSTGASVAAGEWGVIARALPHASTDTCLAAEIVGTTNVVRIVKYVAGTKTDLATAAFTPATNSTYYVRIRLQRGRASAEVYTTTPPTPLSTPTASANYSLTADEQAVFRKGLVGFRWTVIDATAPTETADDFTIRPFTYRSVSLPDEVHLSGMIPGDATAIADLELTPSGAAAAPISALAAWYDRPLLWNQCWNGDAEDDINGWEATTVGGFITAPTGIARDTTAGRNKYGLASLQINNPATTDTGANFPIHRRFVLGRSYLALGWVSSGAGVTTVRIKLGNPSDFTSGTASALTTTPTLRVVEWTPTAERELAYVAFGQTAATATLWNADGVVVCEAIKTTLSAAISSTTATTATITSKPAQWPVDGTRVNLLVDTEILSATVSGLNLTIARGVEASVAATHSSGASVYLLPELRHHYEGKGAHPAFGMLYGANADTGNLFNFAKGTNANAVVGYELAYTTAGAGSAAADWLVDPHLIVGDDYTQGEVAVEVWARMALPSTIVSPVMTLSAMPDTATITSGVATSLYGSLRYTDEWGAGGKPLTVPSGSVWKWWRFGVIRLGVNRAAPERWRIQARLTFAAGSTGGVNFDFLALVPATHRAATTSGKADNADFPDFVTTTNEVTKTIRSDLSAFIQKPGLQPHPDHGLGGELIEPPRGNVDLLAVLSSLPADEPTATGTNMETEQATSLHLAVTPRYIQGRGE